MNNEQELDFFGNLLWAIVQSDLIKFNWSRNIVMGFNGNGCIFDKKFQACIL